MFKFFPFLTSHRATWPNEMKQFQKIFIVSQKQKSQSFFIIYLKIGISKTFIYFQFFIFHRATWSSQQKTQKVFIVFIEIDIFCFSKLFTSMWMLSVCFFFRKNVISFMNLFLKSFFAFLITSSQSFYIEEKTLLKK